MLASKDSMVHPHSISPFRSVFVSRFSADNESALVYSQIFVAGTSATTDSA